MKRTFLRRSIVVGVLLIAGTGYWQRNSLTAWLKDAPVNVQWTIHRCGEWLRFWSTPAHPDPTESKGSPHKSQTQAPAVSKAAGAVSDASQAKSQPNTQPKKSQSPTSSGTTHPDSVTLYLTNGGIVTGELIRQSPQEITLRWESGQVGFKTQEIRRMVHGKADTDADNVVMPWEGQEEIWPYHQPVVVKLMNATVLDAPITEVTSEALVLTHTVNPGGRIMQTIPRSDVAELLFRPIRNERSKQIEQTLQSLFPRMHVHREGMFTLITDSMPPVAKEYRRAIRQLAVDWYLTFFPLVGQRSPSVQQYIVVFEDWESYIEYAASDGVPGWIAVGYFHPEDQVLYCFNMVGERFSTLLYETFLGQFRQARDQVSQMLKGYRGAIFIQGQMSEFLQKLEQAHAVVRQSYQSLSIAILRHELTHALFHNWRLQGVVLSQVPSLNEENEEQVKKKRQYLQTGKAEEKRRLLEELLKQHSTDSLPQMQAANSWIVEGLAGYMEPSPIGEINTERLAEAQQVQRTQGFLPLEFLHNFRLGSFLGMSNQSMLDAYAQSWALCHFLMHRYPEPFLAYLDRLARERPQKGNDTLSWLITAVGKPQRSLEQEFLAYMKQFQPEDPFWLKQMQTFLDLRSGLTTLAAQLWGRSS